MIKEVAARFSNLVEEKKNTVEDAQGVEGKWTAMKEVWLKSAEEVCGWTKGPAKHRETWWWNQEVEEAVENKRKCFKAWQHSKMMPDKLKYTEAKMKAKTAVWTAKEAKRQEFAAELGSEEGKKNFFRVAKQMAKDQRDVTGSCCMKDEQGNITAEGEEMKEI